MIRCQSYQAIPVAPPREPVRQNITRSGAPASRSGRRRGGDLRPRRIVAVPTSANSANHRRAILFEVCLAIEDCQSRWSPPSTARRSKGGCELALATPHARVAAKDAEFGQPGRPQHRPRRRRRNACRTVPRMLRAIEDERLQQNRSARSGPPASISSTVSPTAISPDRPRHARGLAGLPPRKLRRRRSAFDRAPMPRRRSPRSAKRRHAARSRPARRRRIDVEGRRSTFMDGQAARR